MKLTFLGTGAADWDWKNLPPGTCGSAATLLGTSCLIDAGPCVLRGLAVAGASPARIRDLLVTHTHDDHFDPASVRELAAAGCRRLRVWAPPNAFDMLPGVDVEPRPVIPGDDFYVAGMRVVALPANHATRDFGEQTLNYAFLGRGGRLLYALDGAWLCTKARILLKRLLGGRPLTAVVWDATCGATFNDWRFAEHNDLRMVAAMREAMLKDGLVSAGTIHVFDHVARTLWPATPAARRRLAARFGGMLAEDGMTLSLPMPEAGKCP